MPNARFESIHLNRLWFCLQQESFLKLPESVDYFRDEDHQTALFKALEQADRNPDKIDDYFKGLGPMPMGRYFEQLLIYALKLDPNYKLIAANRQIIVEKQTIGEVDLVLENLHTGEREHWEVALKFYLQTAPKAEHDYYLGPSSKDYLGKKIKSLFERQLPLGKHPQIQNQFGPLKSRLLLKGRLYFPLSGDATLPKFWNPQASKGRWIDIKTFSHSPFPAQSKFCLITKPNWMAPFLSPEDLIGHSKSEILGLLKTQFSANGRPQMLAHLQYRNNAYLEMERFFVAPENWPHGHATNV